MAFTKNSYPEFETEPFLLRCKAFKFWENYDNCEVIKIDFASIMLGVSGIYLVCVFVTLGFLGTRAQRDAVYIPKFVRAMTASVPIGIIIGIVDLVALVAAKI